MLMLPFLLGMALRESIIVAAEVTTRLQAYQFALEQAQAAGKPLLVVGCSKWRHLGWGHGCGDVCLDIDPNMACNCPEQGMVGDVRDILFPDKYFGVAFVSHVLEHLPAEDIGQAVAELERVADRVIVLSPTRLSMLAWVNPHHQAWVRPTYWDSASGEKLLWQAMA